MTENGDALKRLDFVSSEFGRASVERMRHAGWETSTARRALLELYEARLSTRESKPEARAPENPHLHEELQKSVDRLLGGEPLQYVSGRALFDGHWLKSDARALIPRPETEEMAAMASADVPPKARILDAMTGSGCLAISLAHRHPDAEVQAFDLSSEALDLARENDLKTQTEIGFHLIDALAEPWHSLGGFDLIVSNPPYIPSDERSEIDRTVLEYEPSIALFAPVQNELGFVQALRDQSLLGALNIGGHLWIELHPPLAEACQALFRPSWNSEIIADLSGKKRFLRAQRIA